MITAVDTNILLDVLIPNSDYCQASKQMLDRAWQHGSLVVCEVVYAELAAQFRNQVKLDTFLQDTGIRLSHLTVESLNLAGLKWSEYSRKRPKTLQCPECGTRLSSQCPNCGKIPTPRQHILADFLIGAHALLQSHRLLTRDRGYYKTYFPELALWQEQSTSER